MSSLPPAAAGADIVAQLQADLARTVAAAQKTERDAMRLLAALVRKAGGSVRITSADLLATTEGTLNRLDCSDGFVLAVTEPRREN